MPDLGEGRPTDAGGDAVGQEPSRSAAPQKEALYQVIEGGKSEALESVLDLPTFGPWAREKGLMEATLIAAWRKGERAGYPCREATAAFRDGELVVSGDIEPPSDDQLKAFNAEFAAAKFPTLYPLTAVGELPPEVPSLTDPNVFTYHDFEGRVVMIRRRYEKQDGGKGFLPWTYWSDGRWRQMEPEQLPFYGLPGWQEHSTLFIHEGEKAARKVKAIINGDDAAAFPWREEMRYAHHIGWIGGTNAISRSAWDGLASKGFKRVVIVADNDDDGKGLRASFQAAKHFGENVWLIAFDQRFDDGFDLGDPWPAALFDQDSRYLGPPMADFMLPATYATREVSTGERGRPAVFLTDAFARMVACTSNPERIMFWHNPGRDLRPDQFNRAVAPISGLVDTATKVFKDARCSHDRMIYRPGFTAGTLIDEGRCFNVYEPGRIAAVVGDPAPWEGYLEHLIPAPEDRDHVADWLATLIAEPRIRMTYGMLLISENHGVGKSTLHFILERLLGPRSVSAPNETMIVESQFNTWLARKRLIFVHEFYSGKSRKAYDRLKTFVTEPAVEINEKGIPAYPMENWAHFIACSNSDRAMHLDDNDRRWLVPTVTERVRPHDYWAGLRQWLAGDGLGIILTWARDRVRAGRAVRAGIHAPMSTRKREIIEKSRSPGQAIAAEVAEALIEVDRPVVVRCEDLLTHVALRRGFKRANGEVDLSHPRLESKDTLLRTVKAVPGITVWADSKRVKFGGEKDSVIFNRPIEDDVTWRAVKEQLTTLADLNIEEAM